MAEELRLKAQELRPGGGVFWGGLGFRVPGFAEASMGCKACSPSFCFLLVIWDLVRLQDMLGF